MGAHTSVVDGAEGVVWVEGIRARALALVDAVEPTLASDDEHAWQGWMAAARAVLWEIANG